MSENFDPYRKWLGIPLQQQPPHHYRLLGIALFEDDPDAIENAANRQMQHVRTFQSGRHGRLSQQILNELATAKLCLLRPEKKEKYDQALRAKLKSARQSAAPSTGTGPPPPLARPATAGKRPPAGDADRAPLPVASPASAPIQAPPDQIPMAAPAAPTSPRPAALPVSRVWRRPYRKKSYGCTVVFGFLAFVVATAGMVLLWYLTQDDQLQVGIGSRQPKQAGSAPQTSGAAVEVAPRTRAVAGPTPANDAAVGTGDSVENQQPAFQEMIQQTRQALEQRNYAAAAQFLRQARRNRQRDNSDHAEQITHLEALHDYLKNFADAIHRTLHQTELDQPFESRGHRVEILQRNANHITFRFDDQTSEFVLSPTSPSLQQLSVDQAAALAAKGFDREEGTELDRPFTLVHLAIFYALDRREPESQADRQQLARQLYEEAQAGGARSTFLEAELERESRDPP